MDEIAVRPRYNRNSNAYYRRRRKNLRANTTLTETIIRQTVISLAVLILIGLVKSLDTAPTNYISGKIKSTLAYNIEIKKVYQSLDSLLKKAGKIIPVKKSTDSGQTDQTATGTADKNGTVDTENTGGTGNTDNSGSTQNAAGAVNSEEIEDAALAEQIAANAADESLINEIKAKYTFSSPVNGYLSSPYGNRISPIKKTVTFHQGVDIGADAGTSITAAIAGEVTEAGSDPVYGNYLKISHGDGLETLYAHCSELTAKKGNKVSRGTTIAKVGNTGLSVGAHLHFEIRKDGKPLDPAKFIAIPPKT